RTGPWRSDRGAASRVPPGRRAPPRRRTPHPRGSCGGPAGDSPCPRRSGSARQPSRACLLAREAGLDRDQVPLQLLELILDRADLLVDLLEELLRLQVGVLVLVVVGLGGRQVGEDPHPGCSYFAAVGIAGEDRARLEGGRRDRRLLLLADGPARLEEGRRGVEGALLGLEVREPRLDLDDLVTQLLDLLVAELLQLLLVVIPLQR